LLIIFEYIYIYIINFLFYINANKLLFVNTIYLYIYNRNCCFNIEAHENMLDPDGLNLLPRILLPLAGPEDFNDEEMEALPDEVNIRSIILNNKHEHIHIYC